MQPEACSTGRHQLEVRAPSLVSCFLRGKLTKRALVNGERQHLLLQVTQRRSSEALVVVDAVVVSRESTVLWGVLRRLEGVGAVKLSARGRSSCSVKLGRPRGRVEQGTLSLSPRGPC